VGSVVRVLMGYLKKVSDDVFSVSKVGESLSIPDFMSQLTKRFFLPNQCHDRATLQGVRIPSAILKIVFRHILF